MNVSIQPNAHTAETSVQPLGQNLASLRFTEPNAGSHETRTTVTLSRDMWQQVVNQLVAAGVVNPTEAQAVA